MKGQFSLSPLGTTREAITGASSVPVPGSVPTSEQDLLSWYREIREPLKALYGVEDEIALIAWELTRW
jgi:hypothetical protein